MARDCPAGGRGPPGQHGPSGSCSRLGRHVDAAPWRDGLAGWAEGRAGGWLVNTMGGQEGCKIRMPPPLPEAKVTLDTPPLRFLAWRLKLRPK